MAEHDRTVDDLFNTNGFRLSNVDCMIPINY